jgi:hypothetical protein
MKKAEEKISDKEEKIKEKKKELKAAKKVRGGTFIA